MLIGKPSELCIGGDSVDCCTKDNQCGLGEGGCDKDEDCLEVKCLLPYKLSCPFDCFTALVICELATAMAVSKCQHMNRGLYR